MGVYDFVNKYTALIYKAILGKLVYVRFILNERMVLIHIGEMNFC